MLVLLLGTIWRSTTRIQAIVPAVRLLIRQVPARCCIKHNVEQTEVGNRNAMVIGVGAGIGPFAANSGAICREQHQDSDEPGVNLKS